MFFKNPEFKKNFRLEVNGTRLSVCFILLALILFALYNGKIDLNAPKNYEAYIYAKSFFNAFCGIGFFFVIVWGTYLSAASINEEIRQKTWDFVRMSSLSPLKILVGKLFGATSLIWIVGLIGIIPVLAISAAEMLPVTAPLRDDGTTVAVLIGTIICWAIFSHAAGLLFSLHAILNSREKDRFNSIGATLLVLICGLYIGATIINAFDYFHVSYRQGRASYTEWYGHSFHTLDIILLCLAFGTVWAVVGAHRMLRQSLLFLDQPWVWIAFLLIASLFLNGFATEIEFKRFLFWPILLCTFTVALMAVHEARDVVRYKTFAARLNMGNYKDALRYMPLWMISFLFLIGTLITSIVVIDHRPTTIMSIASLVAFAIRDLLILHWLSWKPNIRRPLLGYAFFAGAFYLLLPLITRPTSELGRMFFPLLPHSNSASLMPYEQGWIFFYWAFQVGSIAIAAWLFNSRWKTAFRSTPPVPAGPPQTAA